MTTVKVNIETTEEVHKVGDYFIESNQNLYILSHVDYTLVTLIELETGNRWRKPVEYDPYIGVTEEVFDAIKKEGKFTKVSSVKISIEK